MIVDGYKKMHLQSTNLLIGVQVYAVTSYDLHYDDLTWPCMTKEGETSIIHQRLHRDQDSHFLNKSYIFLTI